MSGKKTVQRSVEPGRNEVISVARVLGRVSETCGKYGWSPASGLVENGLLRTPDLHVLCYGTTQVFAFDSRCFASNLCFHPLLVSIELSRELYRNSAKHLQPRHASVLLPTPGSSPCIWLPRDCTRRAKAHRLPPFGAAQRRWQQRRRLSTGRRAGPASSSALPLSISRCCCCGSIRAGQCGGRSAASSRSCRATSSPSSAGVCRARTHPLWEEDELPHK